MTPEERRDARHRGELAERMVTKACELACLVRDSDSVTIGDYLAKFSSDEKDALLIVAAAMIPDDRPVDDLLGWVSFDQYGRSLDQPRDTTGRILQPCGTYAAYRRHLRHKETPCDACRDANADRFRPERAA